MAKSSISTSDFVSKYRAACADETQNWETFAASISMKKASAIQRLQIIKSELIESQTARLVAAGHAAESARELAVEAVNGIIPSFQHRSPRSGSDKQTALAGLLGELSVPAVKPVKETKPSTQGVAKPGKKK